MGVFSQEAVSLRIRSGCRSQGPKPEEVAVAAVSALPGPLESPCGPSPIRGRLPTRARTPGSSQREPKWPGASAIPILTWD